VRGRDGLYHRICDDIGLQRLVRHDLYAMGRAEPPELSRDLLLIIDTETHLGDLYGQARQLYGAVHMRNGEIADTVPPDDSLGGQLRKFADGALPMRNVPSRGVRRVQARDVEVVRAQPVKHSRNRRVYRAVARLPHVPRDEQVRARYAGRTDRPANYRLRIAGAIKFGRIKVVCPPGQPLDDAADLRLLVALYRLDILIADEPQRFCCRRILPPRDAECPDSNGIYRLLG
jgi:hypothetical protein